jgi:hypothetical protein|tara:strand:- start:345 stop:599 length:255 start_codon:yes stop_codon:yes gene_type:complete
MAKTLEEKRRYVKEYVRSLNTIEEAIEPYKDQKRELRDEYRTNGWLNTDEIRAAVRAYRLIKGNIDVDEVYDNFKVLIGNPNND